MTNKIKNAGEFLDIKLLDHLIIIPDGDYFSFAEYQTRSFHYWRFREWKNRKCSL
ncbi:JAB domain-containing protein [Gillisia sp. JM1]|uniref:JAB domain-containing protein n=1 Tax=Gillisia sp. JM1 TaxID=1283286 RepID=UPI003977C8C5